MSYIYIYIYKTQGNWREPGTDSSPAVGNSISCNRYFLVTTHNWPCSFHFSVKWKLPSTNSPTTVCYPLKPIQLLFWPVHC